MTSSDLIVVAPKGETTSLSKRWSSDDVLALAERLLGLDAEVKDKSSAWKIAKKLVWDGSLPGALINKGAQIAMPYTDATSVEFRKKQLYQQKSLVEELLRSILEQEDYIRKALSSFTIVEIKSREIETLRFSAGVPQQWSAYKVHPFDGNFYVPVANFHDFMLHDKKAEFLRLASALGAKSVQILESDASSSSASVKGSASDGLEGAKGKAGSSKGAAQAFSLDFKNASLPTRMPQIPEHLRWIAGEPLWEAMVETRLNEWATELRVSFKYTSDYGLNADVAVGLEGIGVSIGGSYESQTRVDQEYLVEFWPREAYLNIND